MEINTKQNLNHFLILFTVENHHLPSTKDTKCTFKNAQNIRKKTKLVLRKP